MVTPNLTDAGVFADERASGSPGGLSEGELWSRALLDRLRAEQFTAAAWRRFLADAFRRSRVIRARRPGLVRQSRRWGAFGLAASVPLGARATATWALWWAMLDWHLGMAEPAGGGQGAPPGARGAARDREGDRDGDRDRDREAAADRDREAGADRDLEAAADRDREAGADHAPAPAPERLLSAADALTLARLWAAPFVRRHPEPWLVAVAMATDLADGPLARRAGPTRLGRDFDATADTVFLDAALRGATERRGLDPRLLALERARLLVGTAVTLGSYFGGSHPAPVQRDRGPAAVLAAAGLLLATAGRPRAAEPLLGSAIGYRTVIRLRASRPARAR